MGGSPVTPAAPVQSKAATVNPAPSGVSNARILIGSGIACVLIAGLYLALT